MIGITTVPLRVSAASYVIWSDGFEGGLSNWQVSDENPDAGLDYWGSTTSRVSTGASSAWCAQIGANSVDGFPNSQNHYYDQDMDANLLRFYGDISGYSSLTMTFSYWAITGSLSLADALSVWQFAGGSWVQVWSQPSVNSNGWQTETVSISPASTAVTFLFHSDPTVGLGPYEGVYLDDVTLIGIDNVAPSSQAGALSAYQRSRTFSIGYTASDNPGASGLASVTLYYSASTSGPWISAGTFTSSPIDFSAPSDGTFYFHTVATDRAGNTESPPGTPDASTTVDTGAPSLSVVSPSSGQILSSSTVGVSWTGSDAISGIAEYGIRLDGGAAVSTGTATTHTFNAVGDGAHTTEVTAIDRAGNTIQASVAFTVDTTAPSLTVDSPALGSILNTNSIEISWSAADSTSGIERYEIQLDGGSWTPIGTATSYRFDGVSDGPHTVTIRAIDRAGNQETGSVSFTVNTNPLSPSGPGGGLALYSLIAAVVAVAGIAGFLTFRKRRRRPRPPPSPQA